MTTPMRDAMRMLDLVDARTTEYVAALNATDQAARQVAAAWSGVAALGVGTTFVTEAATKYVRIVAFSNPSDQKSIHALVDVEGNVYKPAGWARPAKGVRYRLADDDSFARLLANLDPYGGYLYARK